MTSLSERIHNAGQQFSSATGASLTGVLNKLLEQYVGWPIKVSSGHLVDPDGNRTAIFPSVVYVSAEGNRADGHDINADNAAVIIDTCESLDLETFRIAYARIAEAKNLKKSPAPSLEGIPITTTTMGIIFALRSDVPLESIAEELTRLNVLTPSHQWPDMVVVTSSGTVNYAVQFPGDSLSGDFLPPAQRALTAYTPPVYIVVAVRPTGTYTFNRMLAFLIAHLVIFSPGSQMPDWSQIQDGVPKEAMAISGFQYNLGGELVPVPRQFYNDRYLPQLPVKIENQEGELLCTLQFLPWQDGGSILSRGKLSLECLLVFLGKDLLQRAGIVKRPETQISYVLPITQKHFVEMLMRIQRQSNMVVKGDQTNWVVRKFADEGTESPFMARLFLGIMRLRDTAITDSGKREKFDTAYDFIFSSLLSARTSAQKIAQLFQEHSHKVITGEVSRVEGRTLHVDENIDTALKKELESFLNSAVRTLKEGMQSLARELGVNIAFLFTKQNTFEREVAALATTDHVCAEYFEQTRSWSQRLVESRNKVEHEGWMLPYVKYSKTSDTIKVDEPFISGQPVTKFVHFIFDRLACFVEELTAHCLQKQMPTRFSITETPLPQRLAEAPERFRLTLASGGFPPWQIEFHHSIFDET